MFVQLQGGEDHDATFFSSNEEDRLKNPFFLVKLRQVLMTCLWKAYLFLKIFVLVTVEHISNTKMFPSYISISNLVILNILILVGVVHLFKTLPSRRCSALYLPHNPAGDLLKISAHYIWKKNLSPQHIKFSHPHWKIFKCNFRALPPTEELPTYTSWGFSLIHTYNNYMIIV